MLCGGIVDLMKYDLPPLIEAGYPPEMAYFECIHEAKLIVDLICKDGIQKINTLNSNFAEWDKYDNDSRPLVKERIKESQFHIESGEFAKK